MNTPRALLTEFDTTKRELQHRLQPHVRGRLPHHQGWLRLQHVVNDINNYYPGGSSRSPGAVRSRSAANRGQGTYGYYEVNDRRITNKAGSDIHSLYIQDQWTVGSRLTSTSVSAPRTRSAVVPPGVSRDRHPLQHGAEDRPASGAASTIKGDGKVKVFGSWGMYTTGRSELPRGRSAPRRGASTTAA